MSDVNNLTLVGNSVNSSQGPTATIQCSYTQVGLVFQHMTNFCILKLSFIHCGRILSDHLFNSQMWIEPWEDFPQFQAALFVTNVHTLTLEGIHIAASTGYGLLGLNVLGDSQVLNSTFHCNNNNDTNECHFQGWNNLLGMRKKISDIGGNALFVFSDSSYAVNLRITDSQFSHGRSRHDHLNLGGGGLGICLLYICSQCRCYCF